MVSLFSRAEPRGTVTVKLHSLLRKEAGEGQFACKAGSVKEVLEEVRGRYGPEVERYLRESIVMVNGRKASDLKGTRTRLQDGDEVAIYPRIAGG